MMGSDYPFEMGDPEPVKTVDAIPEIDDAQRQLILGGNFARILEEMGRA
jgi:aminocarboxymuconate-semialdehyde decarboxylase